MFKKYNLVIPFNYESVFWELYDTSTISGPDLFTRPLSKEKTFSQTNMEQPGTLPDKNIFIVNQIQVWCYHKCYFSFYIGPFNYCTFSAEKLFIKDISESPLCINYNTFFRLKADSEFLDFGIQASLKGVLYRSVSQC